MDDDSSIRALISRVLLRAGFAPDQAADGAEAIERLHEKPYEALVLDLMMPRVDGFAVVEHLSETQPLMMQKTIVVTAFPNTALKERLHHLCSVLSKPFDVHELIALVEDCTRR